MRSQLSATRPAVPNTLISTPRAQPCTATRAWGRAAKASGKFYESFWSSFPDARVELQEAIESGDRLIVRFEVAGTHQGDFLGVPATGKPIRTHGITILRFENGKCCERWSATDFLNVLVQIGAFGVSA